MINIEEVKANMKKKEKICCAFCLLGPPASGKGTLAQTLNKDYNMAILTPGDIYRVLREEDSELGHIVRDALKDGGFCPNELTNRIVNEEIDKLSQSNDVVVLDGYPRNLEQLEYALNNFNIVLWVNLNGDYDKLADMAEARRICPECNKVFSILYPESICACTTEDKWIKRWDDNREMYAKRYNTYQAQTEPIIAEIKARNLHVVETTTFETYPIIRNILAELGL